MIRYHLTASYDPLENGEAWLAAQIAPTASTFIDVGAFVGDWTAMFCSFAESAPKGLLFEPAVPAAMKLRERFGQSSSLEIVEAAVADAEGELPFYEGSGRTSSLIREFSTESAVAKLIPTRTLDAEVERRNWPSVDFLKIDAEGYDFLVLGGATTLLSEQRIAFIQFEYNSPWALAGCTLAKALAFMETFDYETFLLKPKALVRFPYSRIGEFSSYSNFVAVSPAKRDVLRRCVRDLF